MKRAFLWGIFLLIVANIGFSAKAVLVKLMYREGVDTTNILALRMFFAAPFFIAVAFVLSRRAGHVRLSLREYAVIASLGILSYYISSRLDFMGLKYVSASVERLVLYTYPTLTLLLSAVIFKKKISWVQYAALLLTYIGIVVVFTAERGLGVQNNWFLGVGLVFSCAITYAFYVVFTGEVIHKFGSLKFTSYAMGSAAVPALLQASFENGLDIFSFSSSVYTLTAWLVLAATVIPVFMINEGIRLVGANNASIIGFSGPVATIFLGYYFLQESITGAQILGTCIVLSGIFLISWKGDTTVK
jgi:drug/metabolite transporter (DMT)-like permease